MFIFCAWGKWNQCPRQDLYALPVGLRSHGPAGCGCRHWILVLHRVAWGYFLISTLSSIHSLVFIPTQLLFTQGCEYVVVYNECLGRWSHISILRWNHLKSLILSSLLATSLVVLTLLSSVLALSEKKIHYKNKFFPLPSVEQFNLPELLLSKAALSLHPGLVWFPFLDINFALSSFV